MTLEDAIKKINTLYEGDSTPPSDGDEDFEVWNDLINTAINIWENEEGQLWKELYTTLDDASDGDKTIVASTWDYDCPTDFRFPLGYVRILSGNVYTYFKVIPVTDVHLYSNNDDYWCYFTGNKSTGFDLHFNPRVTLTTGGTIKYEYYKYASEMSVASQVFEMSDPMFTVYYSLAELKKDEGDTSGFSVAQQKLEAMKTMNELNAIYQNDSVINNVDSGFGT